MTSHTRTSPKAEQLYDTATTVAEKQPTETSSAPSMHENDVILSPAEEKRLLRKVDRNVIPILGLLYLLSFLDRTNLGNAKLGGIIEDLGMSNGQFNISVSILYCTYVTWEPISNLVLKKLTPKLYISTITLVWGGITCFTALVHSFGGLVAIRIFLGWAEAGLFPGISYFLTFWYPRHSVLYRFALFFSSASLAGAFGGLLARGLMEIDVNGIDKWRWIYIIEGLMTVLASGLAFKVIQNSPAEAKFLSADEKVKLQALLAKDYKNEGHEFQWSEIKRAVLTPWIWLYGVMMLGVGLPIFSYAVFLPSIVNGLGFSNTSSQLMTVPPYVAGTVVTLVVGWLSDRHGQRGVWLIGVCVTGMVGYALELGCPHSNGVRYFGTFLIASCVYIGNALTVTWLGNNLKGHTYRAIGTGIGVAFGQFGAIASSYIYPQTDAPHYIMGHSLAMGFLFMTAVTAVFLIFLFKHKNKKLDEERRQAAAEGRDIVADWRWTY